MNAGNPTLDLDPGGAAGALLDRQVEMLGELAQLGLDLARAVAGHVQYQIKSSQDGWNFGFPADPGAAFAKIAQAVRRSLALQAYLLAGGAAGETGLFAKPKALVSLPAPKPAVLTDKTEGRKGQGGQDREGPADDRDPIFDIRRDLGALLDQPVRLSEAVSRPLSPEVAQCCEAMGLDPERLEFTEQGWVVLAAANDPAGPTPLAAWWPATVPGVKGRTPPRETGPPA